MAASACGAMVTPTHQHSLTGLPLAMAHWLLFPQTGQIVSMGWSGCDTKAPSVRSKRYNSPE